MNEENNNPWENTNNNGMTDNTIYVQPSQTDDAAGTQNTAGTDAGPQPMPSSAICIVFKIRIRAAGRSHRDHQSRRKKVV